VRIQGCIEVRGQEGTLSIAADTPRRLDQVTPAWLTQILRESGALTGATITSFDMQRVGEGVGFLGELARITPAYDRVEAAAPSTFIAKFPTADEAARGLAAMYGFYRAEINFYREIAREVATRTPRCYYAAISDDGRDFALVTEDLSQSGQVGDQVKGCTLEHARMAIRELARFHAAWWDHPRLPEMSWLSVGTDLCRISWEQAYPHGWQPALERYGHFLTPQLRDAAPRLNERLLALLPQFVGVPQTIMHGDYRLDNLFFGNLGSGYDVAVIDWQLLNRGWSTYDVAYFITMNLPVADRRAHERELVREYFDTLTAAAPRVSYTIEACWEDYVRSLAVYLGNSIGNVATINTANERGAQLFDDIFERIATAVIDLDALSLVP
jgi:hypothetical protein